MKKYIIAAGDSSAGLTMSVYDNERDFTRHYLSVRIGIEPSERVKYDLEKCQFPEQDTALRLFHESRYQDAIDAASELDPTDYDYPEIATEEINIEPGAEWRYSHSEIEAACGGESASEVRRKVLARRAAIEIPDGPRLCEPQQPAIPKVIFVLDGGCIDHVAADLPVQVITCDIDRGSSQSVYVRDRSPDGGPTDYEATAANVLKTLTEAVTEARDEYEADEENEMLAAVDQQSLDPICGQPTEN